MKEIKTVRLTAQEKASIAHQVDLVALGEKTPKECWEFLIVYMEEIGKAAYELGLASLKEQDNE